MVRWMAATLAAALVLMAGCAAVEPVPEVAPSAPLQSTPPAPNVTVEEVAKATPTTLALTATDCQAFGIVVLVDMETAGDALPAGFFAEDAGKLLDLPAATNKAAFLIVWLQCQDANNETSPVHMGTFGVFVDNPSITTAAAYRDFYIVEQWRSWPALEDWFSAWGLNASGQAHPEMTTLLDGRSDSPPVPIPDPGPSAMQVAIGGDPAAEINATLGGATGYSMDGRTFRFWHDGPDGMAFLDLKPDRDGTGAGGECHYGAASTYPIWTGETACGSQGTLGIVLPSADVEITATALPRTV